MKPVLQCPIAMSPPVLAQHALLDGVVLAVVGVAVVFAALVLVWGAIELITRMLTPAAAPPDQDTVNESAASGPQPAPDGVDGRTLAVLTAAVFAALGPGARIRRIERIERSPASIWAAHGRVAVQSSHRFRR